MGGDERNRRATSMYIMGKAISEEEVTKAGVIAVYLGVAGLALGPGGMALGAYTVHQVLQQGKTNMLRTSGVVEENCDIIAQVLSELAAIMKGSHGSRTGPGERNQNLRMGSGSFGIIDIMGESGFEDLQEAMQQLLLQYKHCFNILSRGCMPRGKDGDDLNRFAMDAIGKLQFALQKMPKGDPKRFPLVAMIVFATCGHINARDIMLTDITNVANSSNILRANLLRNMKQMIVDESTDLMSILPSTPYAMAVVCAPSLAHYVLLHRALALKLHGEDQKAPHVAQGTNGSDMLAVGREWIVWEDGMETLRALPLVSRDLNRIVENNVIDIVTAADVLWYLEWRELPLQTALESIPRRVSVRLLLAHLGVPSNLCIGTGLQSPDAIKRLVVPKFYVDVERMLQKALEDLPLQVKLCDADFVGFEDEGGDKLLKHGEVPREYHFCTMIGHTEMVRALAFAPDGTLYSGSSDSTIKQWRNGECLATLKDHTKPVMGLAVAWDGSVFSGGLDRTLKQWRDTECVRSVKTTGGVLAIAAAEDGTLYVATDKRTIEQWCCGRRISMLRGHTDIIMALALAQDGTLFSGSSDRTVMQWRDGCCVATLEQTFKVYALALAADGALFAGGGGGMINQWRNGECIATFQADSFAVYALVLAPDGSLFSGGTDKIIKQWRNGNCVVSFYGHRGGIVSFGIG